MNQTTARGVVYIATGEKYLRSAVRSARSVRKHCPGLLIHLFGDLTPEKFLDGAPSPFDSFGKIENPHFRSKIDYLFHSPYDETLYLDSDTEVVVDIREVFGLLEKYDMALAQDWFRNMPKPFWKKVLPPSFPQFNGGVILFRNNPGVIRFFKSWHDAYHEAGFPFDQITLRELLWDTSLRIGILPPEYNVLLIKYTWIWRKEEALPKILHFRRYHEGRWWMLCALRRALRRLREYLTGTTKLVVKK